MGNSWICNRRTRPNHGSSPRAWGTPVVARPRVRGGRFIPTCMGNSRWRPSPSPRGSVHPHVHGELIHLRTPRSRVNGSSPRAWGTPTRTRDELCGGRFIPTCMGNSVVPRAGTMRRSVHPHVHGELQVWFSGILFHLGSSPRAWGTRADGEQGRSVGRFIPTCMGNSSATVHGVEPNTVHPHVHGELPH